MSQLVLIYIYAIYIAYIYIYIYAIAHAICGVLDYIINYLSLHVVLKKETGCI